MTLPIEAAERLQREASGRILKAHLALAGLPLSTVARAAGVRQSNLAAALSGERHIPDEFRATAAAMVAESIRNAAGTNHRPKRQAHDR